MAIGDVLLKAFQKVAQDEARETEKRDRNDESVPDGSPVETLGLRIEHASAGEARLVPIAHLHSKRLRLRDRLDNETVHTLAQSIETYGILQPIVVRHHPDRPHEFEIVAGTRRWRAAQRAGLAEVPVVVRDLSDRAAIELALIENLQRQDLNPIEEAEGYRRLTEEFDRTQEELAGTLHKSRSHIANTLRLLQLTPAVKEMLCRGDLTTSHARALLGVERPEALARRVVAKSMTVRETETAARKVKVAARRTVNRKTNHTAAAAARALSAALGLKVTFSIHGQGGALTIHFDDSTQLERIARRLGPTPPQAARSRPNAAPTRSHPKLANESGRERRDRPVRRTAPPD